MVGDTPLAFRGYPYSSFELRVSHALGCKSPIEISPLVFSQ